MPERAEFPTGSARTATSDAAFPSRKAAPPISPPIDGIGNSRQHHYRITVEKLDIQDAPAGEEGLESVSFYASTPHDILTTASSLRARLDCTACHATKLAVGLGLVTDVAHTHPDPAHFSEPLRQLLASVRIATETSA